MFKIILIFMIFMILFSIALATPSTRKCPTKGSIKFNDLCYNFQKIPSSFEMAEKNCIEFGGHLASIHNIKTNQFIIQQSLSNNIKSDLWIGKTNLNNPKKLWLWTDNTHIHGFSNWNNNRNILQKTQQQNCAAISRIDGTWYTENCNEAKPYVCVVTDSSSSFKMNEALSNADDVTQQSIIETTTDACIDEIVSCQQYLSECSDPDYQPMLYKFCRKTCNLCSQCLDSDSRCPVWGSDGFCTNPFYKDQWNVCAKTCKLC